MGLKKFFEPNKFKVECTISFAIVSLLFLSVAYLLSSIHGLSTIFILFFPIYLFAESSFLPDLIYTQFFDLFDSEIVFLVVFVAVVVVLSTLYLYLISCIVYFLKNNLRREAVIRFIRPNVVKVFLMIPFMILFWFFPVISKSVFAVPFYNLSYPTISIILNLLIAYIFGCAIVSGFKENKKLINIILVVLFVYLIIPTIAYYSIGDMGSTKYFYGNCYGVKLHIGSCCYSSVDYCIGLCRRNETVVSNDYFVSHYDFHLEPYRLVCDTLCERSIDRGFVPAEALHYCGKYYEIDLNENGKIRTEAGKVSAYGVCEERVYCFNIIKCSWGADASQRLTAEKCKEVMCDYYTNQTGGDKEEAARIVEENIQFGSCDLNDDAIAGHTGWWTDNFQNVECP